MIIVISTSLNNPLFFGPMKQKVQSCFLERNMQRSLVINLCQIKYKVATFLPIFLKDCHTVSKMAN